MTDLLEGLNAAQRAAVTHVEGPLLVLAGPGSGKTRVVTRRVAYLMAEAGAGPDEILAVTFTNKAADEMSHRVRELVGGAAPQVSTFHRFCARLLRRYGAKVGLDADFTILDKDDRVAMIGRIMKDLDLDPIHFTPRRMEHRIGQLKNELVTAEQFSVGPRDVYDDLVAKVYVAFDARMREQNAADFDDLLGLVVKLLEENPETRARLDRQFRFTLVDEYQDTNLAQYRIARLLSTDVRNLCVTGDPDQSIYSWRGANPAIVSQFETDYPDRKIVRLEENYRSTALILAAADGLIRFNANRKHKDLVTSNPAGEPVTVYCHNSDDDEANFVAGAIREAVDSGERRFSDFAVFVRMTSLWGRLETALRGRHVPYRVVGGQSYFQRKEIKDALAYARLACNPRDDSAFERVANSPPRGIGDTTLAKLRKSAAAAGTSMAAAAADGAFLARAGIKGKPKAALAKFGAQLAEMRILAEHPPATALEAILDAVDFRDKLEGADEDDRQERLGNVEGMLHDAAAFGVERPDARLADFLEMVGLLGAGDERDDRDDRVTVMTLHAAKGLEFPVVFIIAFEHDVMPHERAVQEGSLEEERRLAFVGITRAREKLALSYVQKRFQRGANIYRSPSPFLGELP
ncbi:MAG TPA: UvrD-helicase domain-containing protein, partial [Planctomycetia bacterium]|nr:UvrD-helicase domain-containing protein [Planctomycetia bacterium]